jgi:hypothetical protein
METVERRNKRMITNEDRARMVKNKIKLLELELQEQKALLKFLEK